MESSFLIFLYCILKAICRLLLCSASDDNILKNIEMFDKLSLRFHGRVNFVKDVSSGNDEICCWTYYGRGVQVAEISCTSIVYTSEKKQTKVSGISENLTTSKNALLLKEHLHALILRTSVSNLENKSNLDYKYCSTEQRQYVKSRGMN